MKTRRSFGLFLYFAAASVWMLPVVDAPFLQAAGAGAAGGVGVGVGGGGHAASVGGGSVHASAPAAVHGSVGLSGGLHNTGGLRPMSATYSGPPHYLPGGFTPNVSGRAPGSRAGASRANLALAPTRASSAPSVNPAVVRPASVHNAWTDPVADNVPNGRGVTNRRGNSFSGQVLYPDTLPDSPGSRFSAGNGSNGGLGSQVPIYRFHNRFYNNFFGYPYPYLFSGGYAPYFDGGVGTATSLGDEAVTGAGNGSAEGSNELSAAAVNDLSRPYPNVTYTPDASSDAGDNAPAAGAANHGIQGNTGPDSLVEAVQAELSRRGYFGGKVDAVYGDATHAAIQRFQADQKLPATGRINEATLHALQLD